MLLTQLRFLCFLWQLTYMTTYAAVLTNSTTDQNDLPIQCAACAVRFRGGKKRVGLSLSGQRQLTEQPSWLKMDQDNDRILGGKSARFAKPNLLTTEVNRLWHITSKQNTISKLQGFANLQYSSVISVGEFQNL